jgi:hypothetical protein
LEKKSSKGKEEAQAQKGATITVGSVLGGRIWTIEFHVQGRREKPHRREEIDGGATLWRSEKCHESLDLADRQEG